MRDIIERCHKDKRSPTDDSTLAGQQRLGASGKALSTPATCDRRRAGWHRAASTLAKSAVAVAAFVMVGTSAAGASAVSGSSTFRALPPDADQRVNATRRLLAHHRECDAHHSLRWLVDARPRGIYWADGEFAAGRYRQAFLAYETVVSISRVDNPDHPAALNNILMLAANERYGDAIAAIPAVPPPKDDLTALISGAVFFAAGRTGEARKTWIGGIGKSAGLPDQPLYAGPELSLLYILDQKIFAVSCPARSRT